MSTIEMLTSDVCDETAEAAEVEVANFTPNVNNARHDTIPAPPPTFPDTPSAKRPRGFATMDPALVRAISSKGGKAAHALGKAHEFTTAEATAAGRLGGRKTHERRRERAAAGLPPTASRGSKGDAQ